MMTNSHLSFFLTILLANEKIILSQPSITHKILIPDDPALTRPNMP